MGSLCSIVARALEKLESAELSPDFMESEDSILREGWRVMVKGFFLGAFIAFERKKDDWYCP